VDIAGGSPQVLASTLAIFGGAWNADGTILFNAVPGQLSRINAAGGEPVAVTQAGASGLVQHRFPQFLPDGRRFIFYGIGAAEASGIYIGSLDGGELKRVAASDSAGAYLNPGLIAFVRGTTLMAQHLDMNRGELVGDPLKIADPVSALGLMGFAVSSAGWIAYRNGTGRRQLRWYDRIGKPNGVASEPDDTWIYPELSPDGNRVAVTRFVQGNTDIWLSDIARGGMSRFTFDSGVDGAPVWSPDGTQIVFLSSRKGHYDLYLKSSGGTGAEELVVASSNDKAAQDWSRDGRFLLYYETNPKTGRDLWALPNRQTQGRQAAAIKDDPGERKPVPVANTPFDEFNGQFSPDGHFVAYETNESGRFEIVVQPFPVPSGKWQVSTGGGIQPRWSTNGKELYFISPEGKLMAASVSASASSFAAGTPAALFTASPATGLGVNKQEYAVSRDGRFLINQQVESSITSPITLILNWHPKP
jgi:Tol biopolymer transport system component